MLLRPLAIAIVALLLAAPIYAVAPALGGLVAAVSVAGFGWAATIVLAGRRSRRNAYDLRELRRVHEREELRAAEPEEALGATDWAVCPRCFEEFPSRLRACPRCGGG